MRLEGAVGPREPVLGIRSAPVDEDERGLAGASLRSAKRVIGLDGKLRKGPDWPPCVIGAEARTPRKRAGCGSCVAEFDRSVGVT